MRSKSDWAATCVNCEEGNMKEDQDGTEEGLSPKSIVRIALVANTSNLLICTLRMAAS